MHSKQHLALLPKIFKAKGIEKVIICPGSRNAPLTQVFYREFKSGCQSLVDERSAAYFALGVALKTKKPVIIISTSGTAVLNFAPALAEAFHQGVPLIAITADRPLEWIDQEDNQTIRQQGVYNQNIKKSYNLPVTCSQEEDLWFTERVANEAFNVASSGKKGPVHINVPLREPLYDTIPDIEDYRNIELHCAGKAELSSQLKDVFLQAQKILLVIGQRNCSAKFDKNLQELLKDKRVAAVAEPIANLSAVSDIVHADLVLATKHARNTNLKPDLLIYVGGQVVSTRLKKYLRDLKDVPQWRVSPDATHIDTFKHVNTIFESGDNNFIEALLSHTSSVQSTYQKTWQDAYSQAMDVFNTEVKTIDFSDIYAFSKLTSAIEKEDIVFVGNSSVIRYYQLFPGKAKAVFANRGTSGIDGCVSTAVGIASATDRKVYLLVGDLSFLYDSNGLWNNNLPENLKIVVFNNNGGGIFSLIDGPRQQESYAGFFATPHQVDLLKMCEAYHLKYYFCGTPADLEKILPEYKASKTKCLLEIRTPENLNPSIFHKFITKLNQ